VSWDLLVCSIVHRHDRLCELLEELVGQIQDCETGDVGIRVYRDNLQIGYGAKCQALLNSSGAEYVSFVDDDDNVSYDFIELILKALEEHPDYVGFKVRWFEDGILQLPVDHHLELGGWRNLNTHLERDIVHFNPIRRELALMGQWRGGNGADRDWADQMRALGVVKNEVYIPKEMYYYQHSSSDTFSKSSTQAPLAETELPMQPSFEFVTWI
jgi:hypothetical protein